MPITVSAQHLVNQAMAEVQTWSIGEYLQRAAQGHKLLLVDVRDVRELQAEGLAAGAYHAPRCMLEFWVDPASPYHKRVFADEAQTLVLYCGVGWRSALAAKTLQDMGLRNVAHIEGGFAALRDAGVPMLALGAPKGGA